MKRTYSNIKMVEMVSQLQPLLSQRNKLGYFAARNVRMLTDSLTEYNKFREELIRKHGTEEVDENGLPNIRIKVGSPEFQKFCEELAPYNELEHEVEIMTAKYEDTIGCLTGEEILALDWMFED